MRTSPKTVRFDEDTLWVGLSDGRTIAAPLAWFPRLLQATPAQREAFELSSGGLHRDALLSLAALDFQPASDPTLRALLTRVLPYTFASTNSNTAPTAATCAAMHCSGVARGLSG
ncbi:MAG: DUF2442 domain-containing protein [Rhodoferax sp.]|nr:DUF2442 domain-containing protein [Rhodoferax sp.]